MVRESGDNTRQRGERGEEESGCSVVVGPAPVPVQGKARSRAPHHHQQRQCEPRQGEDRDHHRQSPLHPMHPSGPAWPVVVVANETHNLQPPDQQHKQTFNQKILTACLPKQQSASSISSAGVRSRLTAMQRNTVSALQYPTASSPYLCPCHTLEYNNRTS